MKRADFLSLPRVVAISDLHGIVLRRFVTNLEALLTGSQLRVSRGIHPNSDRRVS